MKLYWLLFLIIVFAVTASAQKKLLNNLKYNPGFIKGADLSTLLQIEDNGGVFNENGIPKNALQIFKDHGLNYIRLRLWHTPSAGYNDLSKTLLMAERIKNAGLKFLLDIHYSDTWADPLHQTKPAAWQNLNFTELKDSVYQYTRDVITALKNQNTLPDIVQPGNEIICGMLWDDGRVCDPFNNQQQWNQLAQLINEEIRGVNDGINPGDSVKIMIHIDRGGDNIGARWFFDNLLAQNVEFDFIGLSFYPWWHGTLTDLQNNLNDLAQRYGKDIIIVETAYPWTLAWNDNTNNIVGDSTQLLPGYPATVAGQKNFLTDLISIIQNVPGSRGTGIFYWEPGWISTSTFGSPWENLALFDFNNELLESISAFDTVQTDVKNEGMHPYTFELYQNYPNPFNPVTIINYQLPIDNFVSLKVYDVLGKEVSTLVYEELPPGEFKVEFDAANLPSGIYFYRIVTGSFGRPGNYSESKKMILLK